MVGTLTKFNISMHLTLFIYTSRNAQKRVCSNIRNIPIKDFLLPTSLFKNKLKYGCENPYAFNWFKNTRYRMRTRVLKR